MVGFWWGVRLVSDYVIIRLGSIPNGAGTMVEWFAFLHTPE